MGNTNDWLLGLTSQFDAGSVCGADRYQVRIHRR